MKPGRIAYVTCPRCRALNEHGAAECFLCETSLAGLPADPPPVAPRPRFRLATMMLAIALIAALLGLWRASQELTALMLVPGCIALVRASLLSGRRSGRPATTWDYVRTFVVTFAFVVLVMASSVIAFFATCLAVASVDTSGGPRGGGLNKAIIAGLVAAVVVPLAILVAASIRMGMRFRNRPPSGRRD